MKDTFPAHIDSFHNQIQTVEDHSYNVARVASQDLSPMGLSNVGYLVGLLHDAGKYTNAFKDYIEKASRGEDVVRGSVKHSFVGVQYLFKKYHVDKPESEDEQWRNITVELLGIAIGGHHGLFDIFSPDHVDGFLKREHEVNGYDEAIRNYFEVFSEDTIDDLFKKCIKEVKSFISRLISQENSYEGAMFQSSMLCRTVASAIIDADHQDTHDFYSRKPIIKLTEGSTSIWEIQLSKLRTYIDSLPNDTAINTERHHISEESEKFKEFPSNGIYTLSLPTGSGKTLTSIRAALSHAVRYNKKRIIFSFPLLSILGQNSEEIKKVIDPDLILEHHSDIVRESENSEDLRMTDLCIKDWRSPVIVTTLVQLLNTFLSGRSSCIRRFNSLQDSIIIIDEVQSVPRKLLSLFTESVNYLSRHCNCAIILCTATQPCFDKLFHKMDTPTDIIPLTEDERQIFNRTTLNDLTTPVRSLQEVSDFALFQCSQSKSLLLICNTKKEASEIYFNLKTRGVPWIYHLSAAMCKEHRKSVIDEIRRRLSSNLPCVCISTQILESGVDVSFDKVIRITSGLDEVIQSAGRCNRHGESSGLKPVYIVTIGNEKIYCLKDILDAKKSTETLLEEFKTNPYMFDNDLQSQSSIKRFYEILYSRVNEDVGYCDYPVKRAETTLYTVLSTNEDFKPSSISPHREYFFNQAFRFMSKEFSVFDNESQDLIVPYGSEGKQLCREWMSKDYTNSLDEYQNLLTKSKPYIVSVYQNQYNHLLDQGAIYTVIDGSISVLKEDFYSIDVGLITEV